jgi:FkbM family methyltransferase
VDLDARAVDEQARWHPLDAGKLAEDALPDPALGPAHEAVVERLLGPVDRRTVAPPPAALQRMDDPAQHAAVIDPLLAPHVGRQQRRDPRPLLIRKPEEIRHFQRLFAESLNHIEAPMGIPLMGLDPKPHIDAAERMSTIRTLSCANTSTVVGFRSFQPHNRHIEARLASGFRGGPACCTAVWMGDGTLSLVRRLLRCLPLEFGVGGRGQSLAVRVLDPVFARYATARIATKSGPIELDMRQPSERLLAYCFHNLKRHYEKSALGLYIRSGHQSGTFVDIGANLGFYSLLAQEAGLHSICFEPEPSLAEFLRRNTHIFGDAFPVALSDKHGNLPLYYSPTNPGATSLVPAESYRRSKTDIPVETFSGLALNGDLGDLGAIKLVKIDVEGHEHSTVLGMVDFLADGYRPDIWCEVRGDASTRAPGSFRAVRQALERFGYSMLDTHGTAVPRQAPADEILASREVFDVLFTATPW